MDDDDKKNVEGMIEYIQNELTNEFPEIEDSIFDVGNEIVIKIGYEQDNSNVFEGVIESNSINLLNGYQNDPEKSLLKVECVDKAIKLTNSYTNEVYEDMMESDIVKNLVKNINGLESNIQEVNLSHDFFPKYNNNDWGSAREN